MKFFIFTSALAATVSAAQTAKEAFLNTVEGFSTGDLEKIAAQYADDAVLYWDPKMALNSQAIPHGRNVMNGKQSVINFFSAAGQMFKLLQPMDLANDFEVYGEGNKAISNYHTFVCQDKVTGQIINLKHTHHITTNEDGLISEMSWYAHDVVPLDATTNVKILYNAWKVGDITTLLSYIEDGIEVYVSNPDTANPHPKDTYGTFSGKSGYIQWLTALDSAYQFDHEADGSTKFEYKILGETANHLGVSVDMEIPITLRANGAKHLYTVTQTYEFNYDRKLTKFTHVVMDVKPLNALAAFNEHYTYYWTGDLSDMVTMAKKHFAPEFHVTQGNDAGRFKEVVKAGAWMKKYQSLNFDSTESFFQALGDVLTNYVKDLGYGGFEIEIIGHSKNFVNARIGMTYTSEPELGGKRWLYVEDWRMTTNEEQKFTNLHITHTTFKEFTGTVFPSLPTYRGDSSGTVWRSMT